MVIGKRNIKIAPSEFKGKIYIGIRQWYEDNGVMKPGKQGINLTMDEWNEFLEKLPEIQKEIEVEKISEEEIPF